MHVSDLVSAMHQIAPLEYAENWDKVGLLVGDAARTLSGEVLLTIDLTERVLEEAIQAKVGAIVAYHPPIFEPLARVTNATPRQRVVLRAIEHKIAVYTPHTALDAAPGGITDWLCEGLSGSSRPGKILGDCRALTPHPRMPESQQLKIVTFVPHTQADKVRGALATAGAGVIGDYNLCSFQAAGTGTFHGLEGTKPHAGNAGQLEHVPELRLEMVCSKASLALAIETLKRFHPYEEPAIDVYPLVPQPQRAAGPGRRLVVDKALTVRQLAERLRDHVKRDRVRYAIAGELDRPICQIGVVPGSGESLSRLARAEGCEVFVTGEMKHHEVLGALNSGMSVILGGHTNTERGYLPRLQAALEQRGFDANISKTDKDPLE
ncbi:MAG: Nif3-like dinuclear metal center hexameric protein, partial [Phycisphaerales bacterium]|nr:Nif3-like dinuclear metal center hexameric protein [Phycisphaerales bacterium]